MTETPHPGEVGSSGKPVTIADLARRIVAEVEPEQVDYLALVTASWERGAPPRGSRSWTGGTVGSGVQPWVLADLVYPLLAGTLAQVLGASAFARLQRRRWWRKRAVVPSAQITLTPEQVERARAACIAHGMTLGLSESEATMLADAVHGALHRTDDG
ncbi:hypothetical protein JOF41_003567 [Saccharothrix coeruleofusca]|uniref:hypothetical protein n=1 Tax=Saccharothrix coeruleofusca TaxID=33919 RepID=UPI001AE20C6D|nr:hypothetical protein [Saccharothrix coeruleofusca]MBP2337389.1 hypothetical protein [Saccharothrix coeruleofusca]